MIQPGEVSLIPSQSRYAPNDGQALGSVQDHLYQTQYNICSRDLSTTKIFGIYGPDRTVDEFPWARTEAVLKCVFKQARAENPDFDTIFGEIRTGHWVRFYREVFPNDGEADQVRGIHQHDVRGKTIFHAEQDRDLIQQWEKDASLGFLSDQLCLSLSECSCETQW
ncbi:uncharacterized protein BO97DRAFT_407693 [Aspergillus homomorphus CBS 101889]|uniref:Uncharacterized protein n=1 Tax=Aspergillus homomorphus (strain CBS 101889) TaxID=1450537 RepID=A0A395HTJ2_ASPHC|nr:hypothetical protein BO97DRAFT_407693 [Aspergillus homomorphus CBS 101889]RAL09534.1 hypothetical protein BO97DRAFT_407693 [Aspergillus homomorphus CBS 101889]